MANSRKYKFGYDRETQNGPEHRCYTCSKWKPHTLEFFYGRKAKRNGMTGTCIECDNSATRIRWATKYRNKKYNLPPDGYAHLMDQSNSCCYICGANGITEKRLCIEHDHTTRSVRGLCCNQCNTGISMFQDKPDLLIQAAEYLINAKIDDENLQ